MIDLVIRGGQVVTPDGVARLRPWVAAGLLLVRFRARSPKVDEVARDGVDVAPDVAHLRVLRGLDLDEWCLGELGQPASDLGLPDPR